MIKVTNRDSSTQGRSLTCVASAPSSTTVIGPGAEKNISVDGGATLTITVSGSVTEATNASQQNGVNQAG